MLNISIGSDHAGFQLKSILINHNSNVYNFKDLGPFDSESVDYPEYAHAVAKDVLEKKADFGVLICGSANGVAITANKHNGIRAAIAWLPELAALARQHNNANIICIPARFIDEENAQEILNVFLNTNFEGGRHQNRVNKIDCL
jgi:ribose 5-phosphate isomerase B